MLKKLGIIFLAIMLFSLAACGTISGKPPIVDPDPQDTREVEAVLYYISNEYVMTGKGELKIPVLKTITIGEESLEEALITELQKKPEDEKITTMLENIKVISVETSNNIAYVNLSTEGIISGGSLQESAILAQIVWTLTELPNVESVQILVDGSKKESLMGHISIEEPLGRE